MSRSSPNTIHGGLIEPASPRDEGTPIRRRAAATEARPSGARRAGRPREGEGGRQVGDG